MTQNSRAWQQTVTLPVGYFDESQDVFVKEATLRKMTGNEEAMLADAKLRNNGGKLISAILGNCVTGFEALKAPSVKVVRRLASADRNFLLLQLRRITFGDEMEANYHCPRCQGITPVFEDLSTIEIRENDDADTSPEVHVKVQDGYCDLDGNWHFDFVFRLPTGEDEEAAGSRRDGNAARQQDALMARCLQKVGNLEPKRIRSMGVRIMAALSMSDRRLIQKTLDQAALGPNLIRVVYCDHCGEEFRTNLDMSHFFPLA